MSNNRILFVLTGHDRLGRKGDKTAEKTGFHLAEASRPWRVLKKAGYDIDFVSPEGGKAPIDPGSLDLDDKDNAAFMADEKVSAVIADTKALKDVSLDAYDAIYFPGGHGTMWDFPDNEHVQTAVRDMFEQKKIVAAVCHGPAALVNVKLSDGNWLVDGKTLSVFTDEEEKAVNKEEVVPFLLARKLKERGASISKAENFAGKVSVDGRLVTGQNPASAEELGEAIRDLLQERRKQAA